MMVSETQGARVALAILAILEKGREKRIDVVEAVSYAEDVDFRTIYIVIQALEAVGVITLDGSGHSVVMWLGT